MKNYNFPPEVDPSLTEKLKNFDNKGFAILPILFTVIGILVVVSGGIYFSGKVGNKYTPIIDETADWKTYKNEKYGFEFRYPADFIISEYLSSTFLSVIVNSPTNVIDCKKNAIPNSDYPCVSDFDVYVSHSNLSLDEIIENKLQIINVDFQKSEFLGNEAYEFIEQGMIPSYKIIFKNNSSLYEIIFGDSKSTVQSSKLALKSESKQILSTFKFVK